MFRGVVLLRGHRAGQPELGPVLGAGLHHVLRAPTQGGRVGRHRTRADIHPGYGPGRGHKIPLKRAFVAGHQVLLGRFDGRVHSMHISVHGGSSGDCHLSVLGQRARPDGRLQPDRVSIQRAGPRLRAHR